MVKIRSLQSLRLWNHGNLCGRMLKMKILEGPGKKEKKKKTIF